MKRIAALFVILFVAVTPLFAASDIFLKIGDMQVPVSSFSWGLSAHATNAPIVACATNEAKFTTGFPPLSQANPLPSQTELGMVGLCVSHKQLPTVTVTINGQQHVLQNASITSCQNNLYNLHFARCATHSGVAMAGLVNPAVHPEANAKVLIGLTPRPEGFNFTSFQFQGPNSAILQQSNPGANNFFQQAFQSKQTFPNLTVEKKGGSRPETYFVIKMQTCTVSSFSMKSDGSAKIILNFAKAEGSPVGFQE